MTCSANPWRFRLSLQEKLHDLYLLDQTVRGLRTRLDAATRRHKLQSTKLQQLRQQHEELTDQHKHAMAEVASLEHQANDADERVSKLREQMNNVRSNKEYSAMLVEVNTLKADRGKVEDRALELMGEVESLRTQLAELDATIAEQQRVAEMADAELNERHSEVADRLEELKAERAEAARELPGDALVIFDRLADTTDGEPMAPIIEQDRRRLEYVCGGCYMQVPVEKVNLLLAKNEMVRCPSCTRILYLEPELKEAMGVR